MYNPKLDEGCDLKIVGVGGAGLNVVSYMLSRGIAGAQFIVMNTIDISLKANVCQNKVLLKYGQVRGPLLGRQGVLESHDDIINAICDARLLILVGGLGGNTASSALPLIAEMAKDMDIFVVCMVIKPLRFDGMARMERAMESITSLDKIADNVIVFQNDDFLPKSFSEEPIKDAFERANSVLYQGAHYIAGLLDTDTRDIDDEDFQYIQHYIKTHDFHSKYNVEDDSKNEAPMINNYDWSKELAAARKASHDVEFRIAKEYESPFSYAMPQGFIDAEYKAWLKIKDIPREMITPDENILLDHILSKRGL